MNLQKFGMVCYIKNFLITQILAIGNCATSWSLLSMKRITEETVRLYVKKAEYFIWFKKHSVKKRNIWASQSRIRFQNVQHVQRFPTEEDLSSYFTPGIRFYFKYDELINHPACICDGVLPMKVKDEVILKDWIYKIVVPVDAKEAIEKYIPNMLNENIVYVENDGLDIWDWSEKVYSLVIKD